MRLDRGLHNRKIIFVIIEQKIPIEVRCNWQAVNVGVNFQVFLPVRGFHYLVRRRY